MVIEHLVYGKKFITIHLNSAPPYNTLSNMSNQGQGEGQGKGKGTIIAPAHIGTSIVDAEFKLGYLRKALEGESIQSQRQRKNIEFLIHYYENLSHSADMDVVTDMLVLRYPTKIWD